MESGLPRFRGAMQILGAEDMTLVIQQAIDQRLIDAKMKIKSKNYLRAALTRSEKEGATAALEWFRFQPTEMLVATETELVKEMRRRVDLGVPESEDILREDGFCPMLCKEHEDEYGDMSERRIRMANGDFLPLWPTVSFEQAKRNPEIL